MEMAILISPSIEYLIAVTIPNAPTDIRDVPTACMIFRAPEYIKPGTIRKPPPIPKNPDAKPTRNPHRKHFRKRPIVNRFCCYLHTFSF